jgi:hypothetical protein
MQAGRYYICSATRTSDGKLAVVSFKLPIARLGRRLSYRLLLQPNRPKQAPSMAASIRANRKAFVRDISAGVSDPSVRVLRVQSVAGYVVVTVSGIRRS